MSGCSKNRKKLSFLEFHIGDVKHTVSTSDVTPETSLNKYLRDVVHLVGTKRMCLEGGCGTCVVVVEDKQKGKIFAVNSCLVSIFSCHGWKIHTIEGIDDGNKGPHPVQKVLAEFSGSQCGYCSSGMAMNMFALYQNGQLTMQQVEDSFGGNICRCTGYRPILTGFKSLCHDASYELLGVYPDIEDVQKCFKRQCQVSCKSQCSKLKVMEFEPTNSRWVKVYRLPEIFEALKLGNYSTYMLVAGNTAQGVYRPTRIPDLYIDVSDVNELTSIVVLNNCVILGANTTLAETINQFRKISKQNSDFAYLDKMTNHISLVANNPVRNIGTLAGNLMTKHDHREFPSDIFLILETVGAVLTIVDDDESEEEMTPAQFLQLNMLNKVIRHIALPALDERHFYGSYKIMPRAQNVRAHVNAGFLFKLDNGVVKSATIVYGAINPNFVHASQTETNLIGKQLFDNATLQEAFSTLTNELQPTVSLPDPPPEYRRQLAMALFYKYILSISPEEKLTATNKSGGKLLTRPVSSGLQSFESNKTLYPLTQPITKIEALAQTTGKAQYIDDISDLPNQLHATLVPAQAAANSIITKIDTTAALALPGAVAFFGKDDIPGENTFTPKGLNLPVQEELFCGGTVQYYNQPVGIIVATTPEIAELASRLVSISYGKGSKPLLTIEQIIQANAQNKIQLYRMIDRQQRGNDIQKVIKGVFRMGWQYHYHMEVQCCNVVPTEDSIDIITSTQWLDLTQIAAATALNISMNKVNVVVRRLGGGFGGKISRNALLSTSAALAAYKLKKPVRMWTTFEKNMDIFGKRDPVYCNYEVGVNNQGVIQYMDLVSYTDYAVGGNDQSVSFLQQLIMGSYKTDTWKLMLYMTHSDNHGSAWTRAPGSVTGSGIIESIMDHISYEISLDPVAVRLANMDSQNRVEVVNILNQVRTLSDYDKRRKEIEQFNRENRWKKKGISIVPMTFTIEIQQQYSALVSIFHGDGSVAVLHGGVEMGQGINTKAAQVCAYKLGIPLDKVSVKPSYSNCTPNNGVTGGSFTTEAVCASILRACDKILARMKPVRDRMNNPKWEDLVAACFREYVELFDTGSYTANDRNTGNYLIYGSCVTEIELDVLTGQHIVTRTDIIEDPGQSMSPIIDIGQVEGAFVMGLGYYITENIVFNENGKLITNRTWTYWPPGAKDIPVDFRVKLLNKPNPLGVLNSKAISEPPMCLSCSIPLAVRMALASTRSDASANTETKWVEFGGPTTIEYTFMNSLNKTEHYIL